MDETFDIDARGLLCPLPVLKLRKRLQALAPGSQVRIETDDPIAVIDIPHFCAEEGHAVIDAHQDQGGHVFIVRKAG